MDRNNQKNTNTNLVQDVENIAKENCMDFYAKYVNCLSNGSIFEKLLGCYKPQKEYNDCLQLQKTFIKQIIDIKKDQMNDNFVLDHEKVMLEADKLYLDHLITESKKQSS